MMRLRLWLLVCMGWCTLWIPFAQASWEFYQQAGEEAYSRGDYATARQMFLAAVREARELGPQDPRLDISLHHLALLRGERSAPSQVETSPRQVTRQTAPARKHSQVHRSHRRRATRPEVRQSRSGRRPQARSSVRHVERRKGTPTRSGRRPQAQSSVRHAERRKGTPTTLTRRAPRDQRPRATYHQSTTMHRAAPPPVRHGKRREAIQTPPPPRRPTPPQPRPAPRQPQTTTGKRSPTRGR
jgi:hypothetical protein